MTAHPNELSGIAWATKTDALLRTYFNISAQWGLSLEQERRLLDVSEQTVFESLKSDGGAKVVSDDVLKRLSLVFGIYRALHTIFPNDAQADSWIKRPNTAPLFLGKSALELIIEDRFGLEKLRQYLDAQLI